MGIISRIRERLAAGRPARPAKDTSWETRAVERHEARNRRREQIARLKGSVRSAGGRVYRGARNVGGAVAHETKTAARMRLRKSIRRGFGVGKAPRRRYGGGSRRPQVIVVNGFGQPQATVGQRKRRREQQESSGYRGWGSDWSGFGQ